MVSIREIKRMFEDVAPDRQLPMAAIMEFQTRIEKIMYSFAELCEDEAGGIDSNSRLSRQHVKLAFVTFNDKKELVEEEEVEEEPAFGDWNEE